MSSSPQDKCDCDTTKGHVSGPIGDPNICVRPFAWSIPCGMLVSRFGVCCLAFTACVTHGFDSCRNSGRITHPSHNLRVDHTPRECGRMCHVVSGQTRSYCFVFGLCTAYSNDCTSPSVNALTVSWLQTCEPDRGYAETTVPYYDACVSTDPSFNHPV